MSLNNQPTGRRQWVFAAAAGFLANSIPVVHFLFAWRFTTQILERMHLLCWDVGLTRGYQVQEPSDFEHILFQWGRTTCHRDEVIAPTREDVVEVVSAKLRSANLRVVILGLFPVVGPVAGFIIGRGLMVCFYRYVAEFYETLSSSEKRRLSSPYVIGPPARSKERGFADSSRGVVEGFWASHLTEENMRRIRAAAPFVRSLRSARLLAGASGIIGNWLPGLHVVRHRSIETGMFLEALQAICWGTSRKCGHEAEHSRDFERVLSRWAGAGAADLDPSNRLGSEEHDHEALISAISAKLDSVYRWKTAFGFLPIMGPIVGFLINGSMGAHFFRLSREPYEGRASTAK